jgi:hypothetical protein
VGELHRFGCRDILQPSGGGRALGIFRSREVAYTSWCVQVLEKHRCSNEQQPDEGWTWLETACCSPSDDGRFGASAFARRKNGGAFEAHDLDVRRCDMDQVCLVLPILPGRTTDARDFQRELDGPRKSTYSASERRIGITKEVWYIAPTPGGDQFVAYMESEDFSKALSMFSESRDGFDLWFKERLAAATGVDLNHPPEMSLPELVSSYEAS